MDFACVGFRDGVMDAEVLFVIWTSGLGGYLGIKHCSDSDGCLWLWSKDS